jgi:hypothetical protein
MHDPYENIFKAENDSISSDEEKIQGFDIDDIREYQKDEGN